MIAELPITRDELVSRASALVPRLRERAERTEQHRRLPEETLADFVDAGLTRIATPIRHGGNGLEIDAMYEVAAELGRGDGSAAWCYSILGNASWLIGLWPDEGQEEYFSSSSEPFAASSLAPDRSHVEVVPGGFRVSGHWGFASGCDVASWAIVGGLTPTGPHFFLVPMSSVAIVDTWFVSGMRGTGSKDLTIDDAFVPSHRAVPVAKLTEGVSDGWALHGRPSYRVPLYSIMPMTLVSPIVGMAAGAVELFAHEAGARKRPDGSTGAQSVVSQLRLAEASAEADAAHTLMRQSYRDVLCRATRGETPTLQDRARARRDSSFVVNLAVRAVTRLFDGSSGNAVRDSHPLQRFHRDVVAASHHVGLRWDEHAEQYGRIAFGLEPLAGARL